MKKIIHIDMDAFYASIEQRDDISLKGKPVVVGGSPDKRSVVAAASYEARKYGIHSAMPVKRALTLCSSLKIVKPDFKKYTEASGILNLIFKDYTDLIEPVSLDESYLDVTSNKKNIEYATEIAVEIKNRIKHELNLTASAGVAPNKFLAKIASEINKPDGLFVIKPQMVDNFVKTLEVKKIWGVGKVTAEKLHRMNVRTCGDLQRFTENELTEHFGKFGIMLYNFARGIDDRPIISDRETKSIAAEITFDEDYSDINILNKSFKEHSSRIAYRLKKENLKCRTISIKLKFEDFSQITRSITNGQYTDDEDVIYKTASDLLIKNYTGEKKVRLTGISASGFDEKEDQPSLFDFY